QDPAVSFELPAKLADLLFELFPLALHSRECERLVRRRTESVRFLFGRLIAGVLKGVEFGGRRLSLAGSVDVVILFALIEREQKIVREGFFDGSSLVDGVGDVERLERAGNLDFVFRNR